MTTLISISWIIFKAFAFGLFVICCFCAFIDDNTNSYVKPEDDFYTISNRKNK